MDAFHLEVGILLFDASFMKKVVLAVFAANAEEEQLVDFLSFGYIELLE